MEDEVSVGGWIGLGEGEVYSVDRGETFFSGMREGGRGSALVGVDGNVRACSLRLSCLGGVCVCVRACMRACV